MNLELIKQRYAEDLQLKRIAQLIKRNNSDSKPENERLMRIHLKGLIGSSLGFTLGTLHELSNCNLLIITDDKEEAAYLQNDIEQVLSKKEPLIRWSAILDQLYRPHLAGCRS